MGEIEFRGKRASDKKWVFGYYIKHLDAQPSPIWNSEEEYQKFVNDHTRHLIAEDKFSDWNMPREIQLTDIIPETLGQASDIPDRNGKKFYSGDIARVPNDYKVYGLAAGDIYEIYFAFGGFRFKPKYATSIQNGVKGYWIESPEDLEVIGNIYDNPELLGRQEK